MGALTSRQHAGVEEVDIVSTHAYKYPPRSGNYFGSHFIMGGERFDTPQPEAYLFGENSDLNFLGSRPTPFPYPPPQPNEPTKTLKSLVNIRKESLRFVRAPCDIGKANNENHIGEAIEVEVSRQCSFNIEFIFDCDVRCAITIYYFASEEITPSGVSYISRNPTLTSETYHYKRGANQHFCQVLHVFNPSKFSDDELLYDVDREIIPIAIHCVAEDGFDEPRQSHTTIATVEKSSDGTYLLKALKQKLFVDGLCYLLQEIYGIENKNNDKVAGDEDTEDSGSECVICMSDTRDTLILPCRHLCLCYSCADSLRYQANNCPICRAPFRALLQIRALRKTTNGNTTPPDASCDNIPPGYEAVSLIEALNGPAQQRQPPAAVPDVVDTPESEHVQGSQILTKPFDPQSPAKCKNPEVTTPEYGIVMSLRDEDSKEETQKCPLLSEDNKSASPRNKNNRSPRDTLKIVNEKAKDDQDEDSEAEKLSPLLQKTEADNGRDNMLALSMEDVIEPIDDADTDQEEAPPAKATTVEEKPNKTGCHNGSGLEERGEDSDYYTPEEPAPSVDPLYDQEAVATPKRLVPGSAQSLASVRSAASYSSTSSSELMAISLDLTEEDRRRASTNAI